MSSDMKQVPRLIAGFIAAGPLAIVRYLRSPQQF
jgi:hypothetical protein